MERPDDWQDFYDPADGENVCFLCGDPRYEPFRKVTHYGFPFEFKRCRCGLVKQVPMPNELFFEWFFDAPLFFSSLKTGQPEIWGYHDYFADEPSRLATSELRYRRLRQSFDQGRPLEILKIGPATGTFLDVVQRHGHHAVGCDVSERFVAYAREHYGVRIDHGRFERLGYAEHQFDVVLLFNVIENVPNPVELLSAVRRTLVPGGLFVLNFVDLEHNLVAALQRERYFLFRPPVCYAFTAPVMARTLEKFGFATLACLRDVRYLHLEKIATLLGWRWLLALARGLGIARRPFPIYAYPSRILVARRNDGEQG